VEAFWRRLALAGAELPPSLRVAAIGPATAQALAQRGVQAAYVPAEYVAEAIAAGIGDVAGLWILLPCAELAREALAKELAQRGAVVHEIAVYRTLPAAPDPQGLAELRRGVDAVTFTSSSTVQNFVALLSGGPQYIAAAVIRRLGRDGVPLPSLGRAAIACIGPITAQTAREAGLPVDVLAAKYTTGGLADALEAYFAQPDRAIKENRWIPQRSQ
jgi:uroporphyrinogen-III synthase